MENIKRAVVTGATGVVGVALIKELISQNIETLVLTRKNGRIDKIPTHPLVKFKICSLEELSDFNITDEKYDVFFHLGWAGTYGEERNDLKKQELNITYTLDAVDLAHRLGCNTFIATGSQAENGTLEYGQKVSDASPENPISAYGKAKLQAARESRKLCKKLSLRHSWCRILSVYGPSDAPYTMVMSTLLKMLRNEDCNFTPAEQQWDYIYSGDVAKALLGIAENGIDGAIYPIGSGKTKLLKDYILEMAKITETTGKCNFGAIDYYPNQPMYLCADIDNLLNDTGFAPETNFKDGIQKTIEYIKENNLM